MEWAFDGTPPPGHTELPICAVCLERMDESVAGVLTILCNHAFHTSCLEQWGDATCPVCRCVQIPEQQESSECEECGKSAPSIDLLWICLICGHVGCGRLVFININHINIYSIYLLRSQRCQRLNISLLNGLISMRFFFW